MTESDLKGELSCPVCMELFSRPLRLGCGHSYCRSCLLAMVKRSLPASISCPECRRVFQIPSTGVDSFPVDFKLSKLVDVYRKMEETYGSGAEQTPQQVVSADSVTAESDDTAVLTSISRLDEEIAPVLTVANNRADNTSTDDVIENRGQAASLCPETNTLNETERSRTRDLNETDTSRTRHDGSEPDILTRQESNAPDIITSRGSNLPGTSRTRGEANRQEILMTGQTQEHSRIRRPGRVVTRDSDDSDTDPGPREQTGVVTRRRRKNKVLRFFSSLLSLSSSDDDAWKSSSSSSLDSDIYRLPEKSLPPLRFQSGPAVPSVDEDAVGVVREARVREGTCGSMDRATGNGLEIDPDGHAHRNGTNGSQGRPTSDRESVADDGLGTASANEMPSIHDVGSGSESVTSATGLGSLSVGNVVSTNCATAASGTAVPGHVSGGAATTTDSQTGGIQTLSNVAASEFKGTPRNTVSGDESRVRDTLPGEWLPSDKQISNSRVNVPVISPASDVKSTEARHLIRTAADNTTPTRSEQDVTSSPGSLPSQHRSTRREVRRKKKTKRSLFSFFASSSSSLSGEDIRDPFGSDDDLLTDHTGSVRRVPRRHDDDDDDDGLIH